MKPRLPILNNAFKYRNSARTDVEKTWREARKRLEAEKQARSEMMQNVRDLKQIGAKK